MIKSAKENKRTEEVMFKILPQPASLVKKDLTLFYIEFDSKIVLGAETGEDEYRYAKLLADTVEKSGIRLKITKGETAKEKDIEFVLVHDETLGKEGYRLDIAENGVKLTATAKNGILYGVQTLRQLVEQCGLTLPSLKITDTPKLPNRGFFHDATRGRVQSVESYKKLADRAAFYKLNQLQLYVEHTYMFESFSEVWRDDTPLTAQDILELDAYCKSLCIELVPSLASFGHLDKVLKTKSFAHLCELEDSDKDRFTFAGRMEHHTLNISDPAAWEFVKKMLGEFMPLFSSKKFNLNGDETFDLGKGRSKALADEVGTHRMYVDFVKRICDFLIENGRQPYFWGDIIVGSPELIKELPKDVVCLTWGYCENEHHHNAETMFNAGCTQYLCPGVHGWRHMMNRNKPAYENIKRMCEYAAKYKAIGLLNTDWGDYGHLSDPDFSTIGLIYGAEGAWNGVLPERTELNKMISLAEFGDKKLLFAETVSELAEQEGIAWEHLVQYMEYMTKKETPSEKDRRDFLLRCHIDCPASKNEKIDELKDELTGLAAGLGERGRNVIYSYLLHAEGQKLFNNIAAVLTVKDLGMDARDFGGEQKVTPAVMEAKELAGKLETWFAAYKANWRKGSRESELYRIQAVIFWLADHLREIK